MSTDTEAECARLLAKVKSFERSFAGHVYVKNEKYSALAKHHNYLQEAYCLLRDCQEAIDVANEHTWTECYKVRDRIEEFLAKIGTNHERESKI
jgi:molecular chaperone GrpE (heat shock protein)